MLELYFLVYAIPKMMSKLARERQRSAVAWSLIGVGAWIGAEIAAAVLVVVTYVVVVVVQDGQIEEEFPPVVTAISYVLGLVAAIGSLLLVKRILTAKPKPDFEPPPPPPKF